jgi:hypothetical protein
MKIPGKTYNCFLVLPLHAVGQCGRIELFLHGEEWEIIQQLEAT